VTSLSFAGALLLAGLARPLCGQSPFAFQEAGPATLRLTENGKPVFDYNFGAILKDGFAEKERRSAYLHPVYAPDGTILTDDFPRDHPHHRGISWAWPVVNVAGTTFNFWELDGKSRQQFVRWTAREADAQGAHLGVENAWVAEGRRIVKELVDMRVKSPAANQRSLEFVLMLEAVDAPVRIAGSDGLSQGRRKGYGGFSMRFAPRAPATTRIRTDLGLLTRDELLIPHAWAELEGLFGSRPERARIEIDQSNPDYPNGWLLRHFGILNPCFPGLTEYLLEPGKPLVLKYRVILTSPAMPSQASLSTAPASGFAEFARDLVDLEALSRVDFVPTRMESSFDRAGGNNDGFDPARLRNNTYTIADLRGPGVVRRIYSARPLGRLRIYLDGSSKPVIDMPSEEFFSGRHQPFVRPVVGPMGGANYSFFPIPYARSIKIQTTPMGAPAPAAYGFYYQVTYQPFPHGTPVRSLELPLEPEQQAAWAQVVAAWRDAGQDPKPSSPDQITLSKEVTIPPGSFAVLADIEGAGVIDRFHLHILSADHAFLRTALLRMRWDEERADAVDCPVGDFFGNGFNQVLYKSLPMGLTESGYYSYFSMPFGRRARIAVVNESASAAVSLSFRIIYRKTRGMPSGAGYFHAKWRRQEVTAVNMRGHNLTGEYNYRVLDAHGQGRYIGLNLNVFNRSLFWWGEGDPMIFVDNEPWPPGIHGTGTEEYFNDAYGFHQHLDAAGADPPGREQNVVPVSGAILPGLGAPASCYGPNAVFSFHLADAVPFRERILVTFEHGTENNRTNDYASTAYWYARPGGQDFFVVQPVQERLAPPAEQWTAMRAEAVTRSLPRFQKQLAEVAADIRVRPTDASLYRKRMDMIWGALMIPGQKDLPDADRARLQNLIISSIGKSDREQWAAIDAVLLEVASRVLPKETGRPQK
jgi:hypothetical protein